jgi:probable rRNA maturation factor
VVLNRQRSVKVQIAAFDRFLSRVCKELKIRDSQVTVCFVDSKLITALNRRFRGKAKPTDVLSFPMDGNRKGGHFAAVDRGNKNLGEIAIAPVVARQNAKRFRRTLDAELRILVLHGVLHLKGYDHEADNGEMERIELRLRRRFGLS